MDGELLNSFGHGEEAGFKDVDAINSSMTDDADFTGDGSVFDEGKELEAAFFADLFRVSQEFKVVG